LGIEGLLEEIARVVIEQNGDGLANGCELASAELRPDFPSGLLVGQGLLSLFDELLIVLHLQLEVVNFVL